MTRVEQIVDMLYKLQMLTDVKSIRFSERGYYQIKSLLFTHLHSSKSLEAEIELKKGKLFFRGILIEKGDE